MSIYKQRYIMLTNRITNKSRATLVQNNNNDIFVVNSARVSFSKESSLDSNNQLLPSDQKLLNYLASHAHWSPFSHVRETFAFNEEWFDIDWFIQSCTQEHLAGIVMAKANVYDNPCWVIRHSFYGWVKLLELNNSENIFQPCVVDYIKEVLCARSPGSMKAYNLYSDTFNIDSAEDYVTFIPSLDMFLESDPENNPGEFDKPVIEFYDESRKDYFIDFTIREELPFAIARQRFKHMVGFTFNEVSRRYVSDAPEYFMPDVFRGQAKNKKQGSKDTPCEQHSQVVERYVDIIKSIDELYSDLVNEEGEYKVCPEQARFSLPMGAMTSYYATGHLAAWKRLIAQRNEEHAQEEIRDFAASVKELLHI